MVSQTPHLDKSITRRVWVTEPLGMGFWQRAFRPGGGVSRPTVKFPCAVLELKYSRSHVLRDRHRVPEAIGDVGLHAK